MHTCNATEYSRHGQYYILGNKWLPTYLASNIQYIPVMGTTARFAWYYEGRILGMLGSGNSGVALTCTTPQKLRYYDFNWRNLVQLYSFLKLLSVPIVSRKKIEVLLER